MGTYTTNYNLFMPSVGEQGWGELVNGNFTTIDDTMSGLTTRIGTLETETDAVEERVTTNEERIAVCEIAIGISTQKTIKPNTNSYFDITDTDNAVSSWNIAGMAMVNCAILSSPTIPVYGSIALGGNDTITINFMSKTGVVTTTTKSATNISTINTITVPADTVYIHAWIKGDGSPTSLTLRVYGYVIS